LVYFYLILFFNCYTAPERKTGENDGDFETDAGGYTSDEAPLEAEDIGHHSKQSLCIDSLISGDVDSFVDLFYLTHRTDKGAEVFNGDGDDSHKSVENMVYLKNLLCSGERAQRNGDSESSHNSYKELGLHFYDLEDYRTALYFSEKALEMSQRGEDRVQQAHMYSVLGNVYDKMNNIESAIKFHLKHVAIASEEGETEDVVVARQNLVNVFRRSAQEKEEAGDYTGAVDLYQQCLKIASEANDTENEGKVLYRLGMAYHHLEQPHDAIKTLKQYLNLCVSGKNVQGEGEARAALAECFRSIGDVSVAVSHLEKYLKIAQDSDDSKSVVAASTSLGDIHNSEGNYKEAVKYFEDAFETAKSLGDRHLTNTAKMSLGTARGNSSMNGYMDIVFNDMDSLLKWKLKRTEFSSQ